MKTTLQTPKLTRLDIALTSLLAAFLLLLAAGGLFMPGPAAAGFGIPITSAPDLFYLRIKGDRDLASALVTLALLGVGNRRALGAFLLASMVQPILDASFLIADPRGHLLYALSVHGSAAAYVLVLAVKLLLPRRAHRDESSAYTPVSAVS